MRQFESDRKWAHFDAVKSVVIAMGMIALFVALLQPATLETWLFLALATAVIAVVVADIRKLWQGMPRKRQ